MHFYYISFFCLTHFACLLFQKLWFSRSLPLRVLNKGTNKYLTQKIPVADNLNFSEKFPSLSCHQKYLVKSYPYFLMNFGR